MATVTREATVKATGESIWSSLIEDPNRWTDWLTPVRGLEERVKQPVHDGLEFSVRLGKISGKIRVTEATRGKRLRWNAGPPMALAMGMGMKMMAGLDPKDEMTKTINRIKQLSEH